MRRRHRRAAERAAKLEPNNNDFKDVTYDLTEKLEATADTDRIVLSSSTNALPDLPNNLSDTLTNSTQPLEPAAVQMSDCATLVKPTLTLEKLSQIDIAPSRKASLSIC